MPVVKRALDGEGSYSMWSASETLLGTGANACKLTNTKLLELAAAPVWVGEDIVGVLAIGFEVSNGVAQEKKKALGFDVAVLLGGRTYSTSLTGDSARQNLERLLMGDEAGKVKKALETGRSSEIFEVKVEGEAFLAMVLPTQNADKKDQIASVLMGSLDEASNYRQALFILLAFTGVAGLIVIIAGIMLGNHFIKPVMEIEEGLLKVINGEYEYRFDVKSSEVGGLGYRINQLIGVLTNEDEQSEEE
jgi:hypothetical protein